MAPEAVAVVIERRLAEGYYKQVPEEPIPDGSVKIKKVVFLPEPTVLAFLQFVVRTKPKSLVVVSHGEGSGIGLTLVPKTQNALVSPYLGYLLNSGGRVSQKLADDLGISLANLRQLQEAATKVRALGLARLDFRACTLGEFPESLEQLRAFFGAGAVSAPKKLDAYGYVGVGTPTSDAKVWEDWKHEHPFARIDGEAPSRVAFEFFDKPAMLVESKAALRKWIDRLFPGNRYRSGTVYFHGFIIENKLLFPGEEGFRDQLGHAP